MLTVELLRQIYYHGRVTLDGVVDDNGRKHDDLGLFAKDSGGGNKKSQPAIHASKARASKLLQGKPVAVLRRDQAPRGYAALRTWASDLFRAEGGKATSPELGDVTLDERAVRDSMAHGMNPDKAVAFAAVPKVIANGAVVLKTTHGRDTTSAYISAPVQINGIDDVVTVHVRQHPNSHRMYLHSVTTKENLLKARQSGADAGYGMERSGKVTSGDVASVLHELLHFKGEGSGNG